MSVDTKHPKYSEFHPDWVKMRDCYSGERAVKIKGQSYLPATAGQLLDGMAEGQNGLAAYRAYLLRAVFPDYVKEAVESAVGVMHQKPPVVVLPPQLQPMLTKASVNGENLVQLLMKINEEQLTTGRVGLLLDVAEDPVSREVSVYIALYKAEDIINWDDGKREDPTLQNLNLVVLNESEYERKMNFTWDIKEKYRVLFLGDLETNEAANDGVYSVSTVTEKSANITLGSTLQPSVRGTTLREIPFVFINSKDVLPTPDEAPFLGLANLALTIYRGEADYRQTLFMQAQETLVVIGLDILEDGTTPAIRVGAGSNIILPMGGDAKYVGVESKGLSEMREALQNDRSKAEEKSGKLLHSTSRERESGEALKTRVAAQTATLTQIAKSSAYALEKLLKMAAVWVGADPNEVKITPNLDFTNAELKGRELTEIMSARKLGAPLSLETIHRIMRDRGMTELEFEEELTKYEAEVEKEMEMFGMGQGMDDATDNPQNVNIGQKL